MVLDLHLALFGFSLPFNVLFIAALIYLNSKYICLLDDQLAHFLTVVCVCFSALGDNKAIINEESEDSKKNSRVAANGEGTQLKCVSSSGEQREKRDGLAFQASLS